MRRTPFPPRLPRTFLLTSGPDVQAGDPVNLALNWQVEAGLNIPFICAANDKRPGGDWETGAHGYEEKLCRRSTLATCLARPAAESGVASNYPISTSGGVYSPTVAVFRGPHDRYEKLAEAQWKALPVVSVPPPRWPKLTQNGTKYAFAEERDMMRDKMRGALSICAYYDFQYVVVGDFGLGNSSRNPPRELAELWREVLLWDPALRGRFRCVSFVFEDHDQSTAQLILDDIAKKRGLAKSKTSSSSRSTPTDLDIFNHVFHRDEIARAVAQTDARDARYDLSTLLTA